MANISFLPRKLVKLTQFCIFVYSEHQEKNKTRNKQGQKYEIRSKYTELLNLIRRDDGFMPPVNATS